MRLFSLFSEPCKIYELQLAYSSALVEISLRSDSTVSSSSDTSTIFSSFLWSSSWISCSTSARNTFQGNINADEQETFYRNHFHTFPTQKWENFWVIWTAGTSLFFQVPISSGHWVRGRVHPGQVASYSSDNTGQTTMHSYTQRQFEETNQPIGHVFGLWEEARVPGENPRTYRENMQTLCRYLVSTQTNATLYGSSPTQQADPRPGTGPRPTYILSWCTVLYFRGKWADGGKQPAL